MVADREDGKELPERAEDLGIEEHVSPLNQRHELLIAVGDCLEAWTAVEIELTKLFMVLNGVRRDAFSHPIRAAYEVVISLEVRIAMIVAYSRADESLRDDYLPHALALGSKVRKYYKKRHEVAHFYPVGRGCAKTVDMFIRPYFTEARFLLNKGPELSAGQLKVRAIKFKELAELVERHTQHVGALRGLPLEHYVQAGDRAFPPLCPADLPAAAPASLLLSDDEGRG